jgi:hypothetical protein
MSGRLDTCRWQVPIQFIYHQVPAFAVLLPLGPLLTDERATSAGKVRLRSEFIQHAN